MFIKSCHQIAVRVPGGDFVVSHALEKSEPEVFRHFNFVTVVRVVIVGHVFVTVVRVAILRYVVVLGRGEDFNRFTGRCFLMEKK